jgi:hypothetical protein
MCQNHLESLRMAEKNGIKPAIIGVAKNLASLLAVFNPKNGQLLINVSFSHFIPISLIPPRIAALHPAHHPVIFI